MLMIIFLDVLLPQVPQSDSFSSSSDDECSQKQHLNLMLPGDPEIDHSNKYLTLKRGTNMPVRNRSHSLNTDYFVPSYETPPPSSSCADINSTVSDESKQVMSGLCVDEASNSGNELSSLQPTNHYDNRQQERLLSSEVSNSDSSVNISSLNQEVYTFVANSLNPKGDEKCETSLGEIFARYCQKESLSHDNPVEVPHETTRKTLEPDHTNEIEHASESSSPLASVSSRQEKEMVNDNDDQPGEE